MKQVTIENMKARIYKLQSRGNAEYSLGLTLNEGFELACLRQLLASLEAEAVGEVVIGEYDDCGCHPDAKVVCIAADGQADWENFKDGSRLYTAPPAPVAHDAEPSMNAIMRALDAFYADDDVPERAMLAAFKILLADVRGQVQEPATDNTAPPAPVSVPDNEQCKPHPVMAVKGELGFLDNFDRIISERDEDIDIGQLGGRNYEALMLAALDAFRAAMHKGAEQSPATDNTAQQFEALATSSPSTPTFTAEELKSFGREMWFDGWRTSPHTPNPNYDCNQAFRGTDVAERLTTRAGSGKQ